MTGYAFPHAGLDEVVDPFDASVERFEVGGTPLVGKCPALEHVLG